MLQDTGLKPQKKHSVEENLIQVMFSKNPINSSCLCILLNLRHILVSLFIQKYTDVHIGLH